MRATILYKQPTSAIPYILSVNSQLIIDGKKAEVTKYITDRKKVERLEKFKRRAGQAAHDIATPLQTLSMALKYHFQSLSKKEHTLLSNLTNKIRRIAQALLDFSEEDISNEETPHYDNISVVGDLADENDKNIKKASVDHQHILVAQALAEIIEQEKFTYYGRNVEFKYSFDPSLRSTFIRGNPLNFERMMCNLIKNSVEALEGKKGFIKVGFSVESDNVKITIDDNGKGMSREIANKLMRGELISTTKKNGHGIGTQQIQDALSDFGGRQLIESKINVDTKITLTIPKSKHPKWVEEKTSHDPSSAAVVLLDDSLSFVDALSTFLKSRGVKKVDTYCRPVDLLKNLSEYSVNTKIFMDNDFKCGISGEDLAKQLTTQGFKNLHILSGSPTKDLRSKYPKKTKFIEKGAETFMDDLICYALTSY